MQGARNPEEWGVLGCTPQQACPVLDTGKDAGQMGVFQQPANPLLEKYQTYGKIVKD